MELRDLGRLISRHDRLILLFVIAAVGLAAIAHYRDSTTYTATTRLVLDTPDPQSRPESAAIADTAKALATSPALVRAALDEVGVVNRDADAVARDQVSVRALGSSGIVQISVADAKPTTAARISNAIAAKVIQTRLTVTQGASLQMAAFNRRIARYNRRIARLEETISSLSVHLARNPTDNVTRSRVNRAERTRDFVAQQRSVVESQLVSLQTDEALRPEPQVISRATPPKSADSSRWLADMLLAGMIGLILGIGTAGVIETVRRRITGGPDLAHAFETPLLGSVRSNRGDPRGRTTAAGVSSVVVRLMFAADAAGVKNVMLFPVSQSVDTEALAAQLRRGTADGTSDDAPPIAITAFGASTSETQDRSRRGLVVVAPASLTKTELDQAVQLVQRTSLPLLGLIAEEQVPDARQEDALNTLEQSRSQA